MVQPLCTAAGSQRPALPLIEMCGVHVEMHGQLLLRDIHLKILPNQVTTLIGPNGAGKTTLIKALLGLIKVSSGEIKSQPELKVGYVPQRLKIDKSMPLSVKRFLASSRYHDDQALNALLEQVKAYHLIEKSMIHLSGGELQRVLLVRALMAGPNLLVLDEPAQGVDVKGQALFYNLIRDIQVSRAVSVLMVSHDLHLVMAHTDEVICLNQHICCTGHPNSVKTDPEFLRLFGLPENVPFAIYTHHHDHSHSLDGSIKVDLHSEK